MSPAKQSLDAVQAVPETHDLVPDEDDESRLDHRVEKCNEVVPLLSANLTKMQI